MNWRSILALGHTNNKAGEIARFLIAGSLNTAATYVIYLTLLPFIRYEVAYIAAYIAGIVIGYLINTLFVFRKPIRLRAALAFPMVYVVQLLIGSLLLKLLVDQFHVSVEYAPLFVIALTLPVTFLLSKRIISGKSDNTL